ncbi:hypothetical protein KGA66_13015 [Actinocrinis puniceicyclus]|uniref:Uncharacterized protein n=1 Tax=Actinocrinis puniceicyclus TaxID=977794 RepID=A0A8J8BCX3_9ACTN|nr:hypothetical protein [Actinocrinis puniceicyclus]MBS2963970.1 hypothetical protein [Actinocrinis puniceicyclus]
MSTSASAQISGDTAGQATSYEVRAELERFLERDLLGPWDGPGGELPAGITTSDRYPPGRLVPRVAPLEVLPRPGLPTTEQLRPDPMPEQFTVPLANPLDASPNLRRLRRIRSAAYGCTLQHDLQHWGRKSDYRRRSSNSVV